MVPSRAGLSTLNAVSGLDTPGAGGGTPHLKLHVGSGTIVSQSSPTRCPKLIESRRSSPALSAERDMHVPAKVAS